jgi:TonB family protein
MKKLIFVLLYFSVNFAAYSQTTGHIQIKCQPEVNIYLDDELAGETELKYDGLIIDNVEAGRHVIEAKKEGYDSELIYINVKSSNVHVHYMELFQTGINKKKHQKHSKLLSGGLQIQSLPIDIKIFISILGLNTDKIIDKWKAAKIDVGQYDADFYYKGKKISKIITIKDQKMTELFVNFLNDSVDVSYRSLSADGSNLWANEKVPQTTYFIAVENMPEPIGGIDSLQARVAYPEIAKRAGVQGCVFVKAFVDNKGNVNKVELIKGIGAGCDEAAMSAVKNSMFIPGKQNGKPLNVQVSIPILFKLD